MQGTGTMWHATGLGADQDAMGASYTRRTETATHVELWWEIEAGVFVVIRAEKRTHHTTLRIVLE